MGCVQVIDHEVERGSAGNDLAFEHQDQMRAAAQFVNPDLRPLEYRAHADRPYEARRFFHTVRRQNDVRNRQRGTLFGRGRFLDGGAPFCGRQDRQRCILDRHPAQHMMA